MLFSLGCCLWVSWSLALVLGLSSGVLLGISVSCSCLGSLEVGRSTGGEARDQDKDREQHLKIEGPDYFRSWAFGLGLFLGIWVFALGPADLALGRGPHRRGGPSGAVPLQH